MATKGVKSNRTKAAKNVLPAPVQTSAPSNAEPSLRVSSRVRTVREDVAAFLPSFASYLPGNAPGSGPGGSEHGAHGAPEPDEHEDTSYDPSEATDDEIDEEVDDEELLEQRRRSNQEASIDPGQGWSVFELQQMAAAKPLSHHPGTNANYKGYIDKFTWWCKNDPATGRARAQPIGTNLMPPDGPAVAGRFLQWFILDEAEGYKGKPRRVHKSDSVFKGAHSALQALYGIGQLRAKAEDPDITFLPKLTADPGYKAIYERCQDKFKLKRGQPLPEGVGPHENTKQSTFTLDEFVKIAEYMVNNPDPLVARDWSMLATTCFTCGRGDDARERFLAELTEPKHRRSIGPAPCYVTGYVQQIGKTLGSKRAVRGCLRSKDPMLCNQGASARYLITRFTIQNERFPTDPFDPAWRTLKLWPSSQDPHTAMSYKNHCDRLKDVFQAVGIAPFKITHAGRIFAARLADEAGVDEQAIERFGIWGNLTSAQLSYLLTGLKPVTLLAMGFWDGAAQNDFDVYWHERMMVLVPGELINYLFPFLETLSANIRKARDEGKAVPIYVTNIEQRLQYEAFVAVQDALELVDRAPDNPVHAMLLKHPTFRAMKLEYDAAKACGKFEPGRPMTLREMMRQVMKTQQQQHKQQQRWQQQIAAVPSGQPWQLTGLPQCWQNAEMEAPLSQEQELENELANLLLELGDNASEQEGRLPRQQNGQQQQGRGGLGETQLTETGQQSHQLGLSGAAAGLRRRQRGRTQQQQQQQEQQLLGPSGGQVQAGDDEVQLVRMVEEPPEPDSDTNAAGNHVLSASAGTFYTPSGGLRKRKSFTGRTQASPGRKQQSWWDHTQHGKQQAGLLALPPPPPHPVTQQEQQVASSSLPGQHSAGFLQQHLLPNVGQLLQQEQQQNHQQQLHSQQEVGGGGSSQQQLMANINQLLQQQQQQQQLVQQQQQMGGGGSSQQQLMTNINQLLQQQQQQQHQQLVMNLNQLVQQQQQEMGGGGSSQQQLMTNINQLLQQQQQQQQQHQQQHQQLVMNLNQLVQQQHVGGAGSSEQQMMVMTNTNQLLQQQQMQHQQQQMPWCRPNMPPTALGVSNNPFLSMLHPNISSNPQLAASLGLAGGPSQPNEGEGVLACIRYAAYQAALDAVTLQRGAVGGVPALLEQQQQQQGGRADGAGTGEAATLGGSNAAGAAAGALGQAGRSFPALSNFPTFTSLWEWYVKPMPGHSKSAQAYEAGNDTTWRHGKRQRWAELKALLDVIEKRAVAASAARGRVVDQVAAAAELDVEWKSSAKRGRNLSSYFRAQLKSKNPAAGALEGAGLPASNPAGGLGAAAAAAGEEGATATGAGGGGNTAAARGGGGSGGNAAAATGGGGSGGNAAAARGGDGEDTAAARGGGGGEGDAAAARGGEGGRSGGAGRKGLALPREVEQADRRHVAGKSAPGSGKGRGKKAAAAGSGAREVMGEVSGVAAAAVAAQAMAGPSDGVAAAGVEGFVPKKRVTKRAAVGEADKTGGCVAVDEVASQQQGKRRQQVKKQQQQKRQAADGRRGKLTQAEEFAAAFPQAAAAVQADRARSRIARSQQN